MAKLLKMMIVGAVLFGGSAAASMMMRPAQEEDEVTGAAESKTDKGTMNENQAAEYVPEPAPLPAMASGGISAETVLRLSESIKNREKFLNEREALLEDREGRVKFMIDDLQREREEINSMLQDAQARADQARQLLEQFQNQMELQTVATGSSNSGDLTAPAGGKRSEAAEKEQDLNLRTVAEWVEGMPEEQAAESIRTLCNDGKMDMAVKLLFYMEERSVSKILPAMGDPALLAEVLTRYRELIDPKAK